MRLADIPDQLDETSQVLWAVAQAPQVVAAPRWCLDVGRDSWRVVAEGQRPARALDQGTLVGAGSALEHAVLALEARHHRVAVELLPASDATVIAALTLVGPGPAPDLLATAPAPRQEVLPADLRRLALAAEAFGVEVLWSSDLGSRAPQRVRATPVPRPMATLVTPDDGAAAQVRAGRALARVLARAQSLGLQARLDVHALGRRGTREELRRAWELSAYPQVQLTVGPGVPEPRGSHSLT